MLRIVTPFFNTSRYLVRCLESIRAQSIIDWRCYLYDDLSTDGSADIAAGAIGGDPRFVLHRNTSKMWQVGNYYQFSRQAEIADDDIIITVDGDDYLPDPGVFSRVIDAYRQYPHVWLTYGQFNRVRGGRVVKKGFCQPLENAADVRTSPWITSHLRTFRAFLMRAIPKGELMSRDGFLSAAGDMAIMYPMIELAGEGRSLFLEDINYCYEIGNPQAECRRWQKKQHSTEADLRARRPLSPLKPSLAIYTSILGGYDRLRDPLAVDDADYYCYSDAPPPNDSLWQWRPVQSSQDPARKSRRYKWQPGRYLADYPYSIWIDGHIQIKKPLRGICEKHLCNGHKIAMFDHPQRYKCIYREVEDCIKYKKDAPDVIRAQVAYLREQAYPEKAGLHTGMFIARRHCPELTEYCRRVWAIVKRRSKRDQLAMDYVAWQRGMDIATIGGNIHRQSYFATFPKHRKGEVTHD